MADFFQNLWFEFIPLLVYGRGGRGITVKVKEIVQFISGAGSPLGDQEGDKSLRGKFSSSGEILIRIRQERGHMGYDIEDGIPEQELDLVKKHSINLLGLE